MYTSYFLSLGVLIAAPLVPAHCLITAASGDLGGNGTGLGVLTAKDNSQADVTVFKAGGFGQTQSVSSFIYVSTKKLTTRSQAKLS